MIWCLNYSYLGYNLAVKSLSRFKKEAFNLNAGLWMLLTQSTILNWEMIKQVNGWKQWWCEHMKKWRCRWRIITRKYRTWLQTSKQMEHVTLKHLLFSNRKHKFTIKNMLVSIVISRSHLRTARLHLIIYCLLHLSITGTGDTFPSRILLSHNIWLFLVNFCLS